MDKEWVYVPQREAIALLDQEASRDFWTDHWNKNHDWINRVTKRASRFHQPIRLIRRYCQRGERILEGGCGMGQIVYWLHHNGYRCTGIDYTTETVAQLNEHVPELTVHHGDVFDLSDFAEGSFDAYYSGGVIEHFWDGYDGILKEAHRVLRAGGVLLLCFPVLSRARERILSLLPVVEEKPERFFQFYLRPDLVRAQAEAIGFRLIGTHWNNGLQGFVDQHPKNGMTQWLLRNRAQFLPARVLSYLVSDLLNPLGYSHSVVLALRRL